MALAVATAPARATQQALEAIMVEGEQKYSQSVPLDQAQEADPALWQRLQQQLPEGRCSALRRGYVGTWEVAGDELRLLSVKAADCRESKPIPLSVLFPDTQVPVVASWFSGELWFERGPMVPGPCGYSPTCPTGHDVLVFERGRRVRSEYRPFEQER